MTFISKISPWTAQPLTEAAKDEKFKELLNLRADRVIYGRQAILVSWVIFSVGIGFLGVSGYGWYKVLSIPPPEPLVIEVDKIGGDISRPVGIKDAPKLFGPATEEHFLRQFLMARERWTPERDKEDDHVVRVMSSPAEQVRLNEYRADPSWTTDHCKDCYIAIENAHYFPGPTDKATGTHHYEIRFTRQVWHRATTGAYADPKEPWTAIIDFQWHPDAQMIPEDREINLGGFMEINYHASSDLKDMRRR